VHQKKNSARDTRKVLWKQTILAPRHKKNLDTFVVGEHSSHLVDGVLSMQLQEVEIGQQNPCEKECHLPKLSVRVQNEKMRNSTICKEESHKILCEREIQKLNEKDDETCEELFTCVIISSSSLVPCVM
jgi:hypothetical protein